MKTAQTYLNGNVYPGRGIIVGLHCDGQTTVMAYFIMGRSDNSRNRIFLNDGNGLRTHPFESDKLKDPALVIYSPVRVFGNQTIIANGDHTDTIYERLSECKTFEDAMRSWTFEPDPPHHTPRIAALVTKKPRSTFSYKMSILKASEGSEKVCQRFFYEYDEPVVGEGHLIHTYLRNAEPALPSFVGEPVRIGINGSIEAFTRTLWAALDPDNKVALFVRYTDLFTGQTQSKLVNRHQT